MNRIRFIHRVLVAVVLLVGTSALHAQSGTMALPALDWKHFRAAHPFHIQTVALSATNGQGHRTLVISEPPPTITLADIRGLDPALSLATTQDQAIGVDGWVRDVVVDLPPLEEQALQQLLGRLQQKLFGTSYKAYVTPISSGENPPRHSKLNLEVSSSDLRSWVLGVQRQTPWGSQIGGVLVGLVLLLVGLALLAFGKIVFGLLFTASGLYGMFSSSAWLTLALIGLLIAGLAVQRIKAGEAMQALGCGLAGVALLVSGSLGLRSQQTAPATLFSSLFGNEQMSCASILEQHKNGVFLSRQPGLVLWSFPRSSPVDALQIEIREFALDSDLVIGAVSSQDQVAILARERTTGVAQLPPLRTETILQLAAAHEDELQQSYERNNPLSGRYDQVKRLDWAPIYLSPRLIDTEYGSLLNITDQLLKAWSTHGTVEYARFRYPTPSSYPFRGDLMTQLGTDELTFNWNTKGVGYVTHAGPYELIAFNRTGSLPIDYLAVGRPDVRDAEDTAYKYYSEMNDPNLVRVVQYAALYQIFHRFGVTAQAGSNPQPPASPLLNAIPIVLRRIQSISDADLSGLTREGDDDLAQKARTARDGLRSLDEEDSDHSQRRALVAALASRDGMKQIDEIQDPATREKLLMLIPAINHVGQAIVSSKDKDTIRQIFTMLAGARDSVWIHTPSVVVSRQVVDSDTAPALVGGHNLSSAVTTFEQDPTVRAGSVIVEERNGIRIVDYNPSDDDAIGSTVREVARDDTRTAEQIKTAAEKILTAERRAPHSLGDGLGFDAGVHPDAARGFEAVHAPGSVDGLGFRRSAGTVSSADTEMLKKLAGDGRAVLIARDQSGRYIISAPPAAPLEASDMASSVDAYLAVTRDARQGEVSLHLRGFDDRQAEGMLHNLEPHSDAHPTIVSTEEAVDPEEFVAILEQKYDITKAQILEPHVTYEGGSAHIEQSISLPARESGVKGLVLSIRVSFENVLHVTREMLADFSNSLSAILAHLNPNDTAANITRQLARELRGKQNFGPVRLKVEQQGKTLYWVYKENFHVRSQSPSQCTEETGSAA